MTDFLTVHCYIKSGNMILENVSSLWLYSLTYLFCFIFYLVYKLFNKKIKRCRKYSNIVCKYLFKNGRLCNYFY